MPLPLPFLAMLQWFSISFVETSVTSCEDKLEDCTRFIGKGPKGGGCESHADYMRAMCASSCGFCSDENDAGPKLLAMESLSLPGSLSGLPVRKVAAKGIRQWHFFELPALTVGSDSCLASGNCDYDGARMVTHIMAAHYYDSLGHNLRSPLYRWSDVEDGFIEHQGLRTAGAWDLASFQIDSTWFLAIASFNNGSTRQLNSTVYRWSLQNDAFEFHQSLPTVGAMDVEFFSKSDNHFLVFAGNSGDNRKDAKSACTLYRWNSAEGLFGIFQSLEISGGYDVEAFAPDDETEILVVVHELQTDVYRAGAHDLRSTGDGFTLAQSLPIAHARDAEHILIDGAHVIVLSVFRNDVSYNAHSVLYVWHVVRGKLEILHQFLAGQGAIDAEYLNSSNGQLLLMASQRDGFTRQYHLSLAAVDAGIQEVANSSWVTPRVYDIAWHYAQDAKCYLIGVARFGD